MRKECGFSSTDPLKNLRRTLRREKLWVQKEWSPLKVHVPSTGFTRKAALVANGIVTDLVEWYLTHGKGNVLSIISIILRASLSVFSNRLRDWVGKLSYRSGKITRSCPKASKPEINGKSIIGFVCSSIKSPYPLSRPFRGERKTDTHFSVVVHGSLRRLALAVPFLWRGFTPFWIKSQMDNATIHTLNADLCDSKIVLDGEVLVLPTNGSTHFTVQCCPPQTLLFVP